MTLSLFASIKKKKKWDNKAFSAEVSQLNSLQSSYQAYVQKHQELLKTVDALLGYDDQQRLDSLLFCVLLPPTADLAWHCYPYQCSIIWHWGLSWSL